MSQDFTDLSTVNYVTSKPKTYAFLNKLNIDKFVSSKLSLNLNRIVTGSNEIYLTPIGKDFNPDDLLLDLDNLVNSNKDAFSANLWDLEQSNRSKFGPRSICKPWSERKLSLLDYFKDQDVDRNSSLSLLSIPLNASHKLRPLSVANASKYIKTSTNSGLPFYTRKGKVLEETCTHFLDLLNRKDPCVLFTRTQEGGKTRNVWGYPLVDTLNEMRFYQPLLSHQKRLLWRSALLGPDAVDQSVSDMMFRYHSSDTSFISIDFSSFDASVDEALQSKCFSYISNLFQTSSSEDLEYIRRRFNTIGIITPNGVIEGSHGVPSGATFTNEVDSLAQIIVASDSGLILDRGYQVQGDDGVYAILNDNVDSFIESFKRSGLYVNEEKSHVSSDFVVYLQRLYDFRYAKNGFIGGIYSLYRALNRIIYQERYSDFEDYSLKGSDYYSIRTICILENCKYHPLFKEFVKLIATKDKYSLKFSREAIDKYYRMSTNGPGSTGFINNQFGDNVKGLLNFATIKVINELGLKPE